MGFWDGEIKCERDIAGERELVEILKNGRKVGGELGLV